MIEYGPLFDGVFGDISFNTDNGSVEIDLFSDRTEYLENSIRGRLKSLPGDYGSAYKYNLFGMIGTGNVLQAENTAKNTVRNMLSFDELINPQSLSVSAMRQKHQMIIGIRVIELGRIRNGKLDMIVTREDNGKLI